MLPIRPIRRMKHYEEHMEFVRYNRKRQNRRLEESASESPGRDGESGSKPSFPYAKDSELHAAEDFARAIAAVLMAAADVKLHLEPFHEKKPGFVLAKRLVMSSNPSAVSAYAEPETPPAELRLDIRRLASAQLNRTALFAPDSPTTVGQGNNRILIRCGSTLRETELFVFQGDRHRQVLARLRDNINRDAAGVTARLETDPDSGRIRLALEGTSTGGAHSFTLQDSTGNMAQALGLLVKDRSASDALLRVDGGEWTSYSSNKLRLEGTGVSLELHSITLQPVQLRIVPDIQRAVHKLQELINTLRRWEDELQQQAEYMNPFYGERLASLLSETTLELLPLNLEYRYEETYEQLFGTNGFIPRIRNLVSRMEAGPAEELMNRSNTRYKRYANYLASLDWYSQLPSQGLLVNRFF